ncbi:MAG: hypothetical protein LUI08_03855 [Prevotella sp.]|nr:hypothetical protein [Prevotella sp.]
MKFGFGNVGIFDKRYERPILEIDGDIEISGNATFGMCSRLCVMKGGKLSIGGNFVNTAKMTVVCGKSITIGGNFLASWDTMIMDTDFHDVENVATGTLREKMKPITIGNNVWMGMRSIILKGSVLPNDCVVAAQSVVNKAFVKPCVVIGGNPAVVKLENVRRKL